MKPLNEFFVSGPLSLVIHDLHPAHGLHTDIRDRLTNAFIDNDQTMRRFSKQSLVQLAQKRITVTGSKKAPCVISGWSVLHSLQKYQIEEPITCIAKWKLSESKIREMCYIDFFIQPQIERYDEIAQRIRAITMDQHIGDHELKELLSIDAATPRELYNLPTHKGKRLDKTLQPESKAVQHLITEAPKPLGTKETKTSSVTTAITKEPSTVEEQKTNNQEDIDDVNDSTTWSANWSEFDEPW